MELLDRYLHAIEFWLPKRQRHDIIAELSEDLRSQIEEKANELGRTLNDAEVEAILKHCGSPLVVASRYLPQQYLIGPILFPIYRFVLAVLVLGCVVPRLLAWLVFLIADPTHRGYLHMENMLGTVVFFAFFTTLAFAIVENSSLKLKLLESWNPRKLPPVRDSNHIPRFNSLCEIVAGAVFNIWFISLFWPRPVIDLYGAQLTLAPVWQLFFWSSLLIASANLVMAGVNLFRPHWTQLSASFRLASDAAGAGLFCWLLKSQILVAVTAQSLTSQKSILLTNLINTWMAKMLPWAIVVTVVVLGGDVYRIIRLRRASQNRASTGPAVSDLSTPVVNGN